MRGFSTRKRTWRRKPSLTARARNENPGATKVQGAGELRRRGRVPFRRSGAQFAGNVGTGKRPEVSERRKGFTGRQTKSKALLHRVQKSKLSQDPCEVLNLTETGALKIE